MAEKNTGARIEPRASRRKSSAVGEDPVRLLDENRASYLIAAREINGFNLGADRVDIRRWPVFAADARLVGAVDRLLVESATGRIRYVSVSLIREAVHEYFPTRRGTVLVPIGLVRRVDDRQAVVLEGLASSQLAAAPRLFARSVTRGDEIATLAVYGMPNLREAPPSDFYKSPAFDDSVIAFAH